MASVPEKSVSSVSTESPSPDRLWAEQLAIGSALLIGILIFMALFHAKLLSAGGEILGPNDLDAYGWVSVVGILLQVVIHELGTILVAWCLKLPVRLRFFGFGANATAILENQPRRVWTDAVVGFAGPLTGTAVSVALALIYDFTDEPLFLGMACVGYFYNLITLIPILDLEGGWIAPAVAPQAWLLGLVATALELTNAFNLVLLCVVSFALPRFFLLLRARAPRTDLACTTTQRVMVAIGYFALVIGLAWFGSTTFEELPRLVRESMGGLIFHGGTTSRSSSDAQERVPPWKENGLSPDAVFAHDGGMNVNLLDLKAQNGALEPELQEAFLRVLRSGYFILGPEVDRFERALAEFTGAKHALGVSSGTDAILVALMALGIGPGDEVLCPSFTFFATAGCVTRVGATPVFVDSCPVCFNLDCRDAARRITPRTKAIIPVHLFGQAAEMDGVLALAQQHGLRVIEDAAQAMGATYRGKQVGTLGDFGTLSFFPTKNLGALGDAGALLTNDTALFERAKILRMHGMEPKYYHQVVGGNFRLDALQAAMLSVKLPHFNDYTAARRRNAALYTERLAQLSGVKAAQAEDCGCAGACGVGTTARLILPVAYSHNGHIWNQYTLRVIGAGRRDALRAHLTARGVGSEIYYPLPLHEQACFANLGGKPEDFPWAHRLAGEVISLPIYPEIPVEQIEQVCAVIAEFLQT